MPGYNLKKLQVAATEMAEYLQRWRLRNLDGAPFAWRVAESGDTAVGTEVTFEAGERTVTLTPLWSDVDGVVIDMDDSDPDEPMPTELARKVARGLFILSAIEAPAA